MRRSGPGATGGQYGGTRSSQSAAPIYHIPPIRKEKNNYTMPRLIFPPSLPMEDLLYRAMEAKAEGPQIVRDQHVISQALLRRFAARQGMKDNQICYLSTKYSDKVQLGGPNQCGKVRDFVRHGSDSLEKVWKNVEDKLPDTFEAIDSGTALQDEQHIDRIKDLIALHLVRNTQLSVVANRALKQSEAQTRANIARNPDLLRRYFLYKHGLEPASLSDFRRATDEFVQESGKTIYDGTFFRARIEDQYRRVRAAFQVFGIHIGVAKSGEFLIGDASALTMRRDTWASGFVQGIAIGDAHSVVLPVGPKVIVGIASDNTQEEISLEAIEGLNRRQVYAAHDYVYFRPGSGLERFTRSALSRKGDDIPEYTGKM